jgi:hypothetical protein
LRSLLGLAFQKCEILHCFFHCETWARELTPWSFIAVFLSNYHKGPFWESSSRVFLWCLFQ